MPLNDKRPYHLKSSFAKRVGLWTCLATHSETQPGSHVRLVSLSLSPYAISINNSNLSLFCSVFGICVWRVSRGSSIFRADRVMRRAWHLFSNKHPFVLHGYRVFGNKLNDIARESWRNAVAGTSGDGTVDRNFKSEICCAAMKIFLRLNII